MSDAYEKQYEKEHVKRILRLTGAKSTGGVTALRTGRIGGILLRSAETLSKDIYKFRQNHPQTTYRGGTFRMTAAMEKQIAGTLITLRDDITMSIEDAMVNEWSLANKKNDGLVEKFIKGKDVPPPVLRSMNQLNFGAMNAFISRVDNGMNLSGRVWNTAVVGNKDMLEEYVASGITLGRSADKISRDVREMLVEPHRLFRRVRDEQGRLGLSKAARAYHPGAGAYRSSYKNALRMAATETNMSYRMSDSTRRQQLPFITGFEVHLSASHPALDICDDMAGVYPVSFVFTGWHPWCICYTTSKMLNVAEFKQFLKTGEIDQARFVRDIPGRAQKYLEANGERLLGYKNPPYWMIDNLDSKFKLIKNELTPAIIQIPPVEKILEKNISKMVHSINFEPGGLGRGWNNFYACSNNLVDDVLESGSEIVPKALLPKGVKSIPAGIRHHYMNTAGQYRWIEMYEVPQGVEISMESRKAWLNRFRMRITEAKKTEEIIFDAEIKASLKKMETERIAYKQSELAATKDDLNKRYKRWKHRTKGKLTFNKWNELRLENLQGQKI